MSESPQPGDVLAGRYALQHHIGTGATAEVWAGVDQVLNRRCALKILHKHLADDEDVRARFRREATTAARLHHPNIVAVYDTVTEPVDAVVLELVDGQPLRDLMRAGRLDLPHALHVAHETAAGLGHAHRNGVVHRDVKPANILLSGDGRVLVSDLGLAKVADVADVTRADGWGGTPRYLSPEVIDGRPATGASDVYSLGIVLFEAICGRGPFGGESEAATAVARITRPPLRARQVRADVPRDVDDLLAAMLASDPASRPRNGDDARAAIAALGRHRAPVIAPPPPADGPKTPPHGMAPSFRQSERRFLVPAVVVVLLALALGAAGVLLGGTEVGRDIVRATKDAVGLPSRDPLATVAVSDFDPAGDGAEHPELAVLAIDGDPDTAWTTESYREGDLGTKPGVGLVVRLDGVRRLEAVRIVVDGAGWAADVYAVNEAPGVDQETLAGWGAIIGRQPAGDAGRNTIDVATTDAAAVLVWFTRLSDGSSPYAVAVSELVPLGT